MARRIHHNQPTRRVRHRRKEELLSVGRLRGSLKRRLRRTRSNYVDLLALHIQHLHIVAEICYPGNSAPVKRKAPAHELRYVNFVQFLHSPSKRIDYREVQLLTDLFGENASAGSGTRALDLSATSQIQYAFCVSTGNRNADQLFVRLVMRGSG